MNYLYIRYGLPLEIADDEDEDEHKEKATRKSMTVGQMIEKN